MTALMIGVILILFAYSVFATAALSEKQKLHEVARKEVCKQDVIIKDYSVMYTEALQDNRDLREEAGKEVNIKRQFVALHQDYIEQRQINKTLKNKLRKTSEMLGESEAKLYSAYLPKTVIDTRKDYMEGSE